MLHGDADYDGYVDVRLVCTYVLLTVMQFVNLRKVDAYD
jgi:hypothetical protein